MNYEQIITIDGREVDICKRDVDTLYLCTLDEYCERTGQDLQALIATLESEINMLDAARLKYSSYFRESPYMSDTTNDLILIIRDIEEVIKRKKHKLKRYKESYECSKA